MTAWPSRCRFRAPYHAQRAARHDRRTRGDPACRRRHDRHQGHWPRRPCLDAARHARPGPACEIVMALQAMITRRFDAAEAVVVTITQLDWAARTTSSRFRPPQGYHAHADAGCAQGRARGHSPCRREHRPRARLHGRGGHHRGLPADVCDPRAVDLAEQVATALGGEFLRLEAPLMGRKTSPTCSKGAGGDVLSRRGRGRRRLAQLLRSIRAG